MKLMKQAGLHNKEVNIRKVQRFLCSKEYRYLQARQKGLLTESDLWKLDKYRGLCFAYANIGGVALIFEQN